MAEEYTLQELGRLVGRLERQLDNGRYVPRPEVELLRQKVDSLEDAIESMQRWIMAAMLTALITMLGFIVQIALAFAATG